MAAPSGCRITASLKLRVGRRVDNAGVTGLAADVAAVLIHTVGPADIDF
jgi:hypothetical protein